MSITICTPTYNREYILEQLYQSLQNQTSNDFVWLIVDDGSKDNTELLINRWINSSANRVKIKYIYQENAGEMQALNTGIDNTETELFLFVDSDDYLSSTAIEDILKCWERNKPNIEDKKLCGVLAYHGETETKIYGGKELPIDGDFTTLSNTWDRGYRYTLALIYRTDILKKHKFPFFPGEKFITEKYIYDQIDQGFQFAILRKVVQIKEFHEDGLSVDIVKVHMKNPKGMALYYNQGMKLHKKFLDRLKDAANYVCYSLVSNERCFICHCNKPLYVIIMFIPGLYLYRKRKEY